MGLQGGSWGLGTLRSLLIRAFSSKHPDAQQNTKNIEPSVENLDPVNGRGITVLMCEQSDQRYRDLYQEQVFQPLHPDLPALVSAEGEEHVEQPVEGHQAVRPIEVVGKAVDVVEEDISEDS